jgi:hypothetical protein
LLAKGIVVFVLNFFNAYLTRKENSWWFGLVCGTGTSAMGSERENVFCEDKKDRMPRESLSCFLHLFFAGSGQFIIQRESAAANYTQAQFTSITFNKRVIYFVSLLQSRVHCRSPRSHMSARRRCGDSAISMHSVKCTETSR